MYGYARVLQPSAHCLQLCTVSSYKVVHAVQSCTVTLRTHGTCEPRSQQGLPTDPRVCGGTASRQLLVGEDLLHPGAVLQRVRYPVCRLPLHRAQGAAGSGGAFSVPPRTALHRTAPHLTALHRTALHCTAPHCTALHRTVPHCTVPYCGSVGHASLQVPGWGSHT